MSIKPPFCAHTPPEDEPDRWQTMAAHTTNVEDKAVQFAQVFHAEELARWAARLHDIGKFSPEFQEYLDACHQAALAKKRPPKAGSAEHKCAGTRAALDMLPQGLRDVVALCVLGHHGGLNAASDTNSRVAEQATKQDLEAVIATAKREFADLSTSPLSPQDIPAFQYLPKQPPDLYALAFEMLARFVFSCLVDADSLDTEAHFEPDKVELRKTPELTEVAGTWMNTLDGHVRALQESAPESEVKRVRKEVYAACLEAAKKSPGVFALTVPTGGGKTLASLAFALAHAIAHEASEQNQRSRIIYAIPYTSIIDQTAKVFRGVVGEKGVLEHHSAIEPRFSKEEEGNELQQSEASRELQRRLASENWQHPLVVTTTVQLFESLFSNRTSRCRKLHNIARCVLILDEVQTLPPHLLTPLLDGLRALVEQFGVTVVLCTATQPAVEGETPYLRGLPQVTRIIEDPKPHFKDLQRVTYRVFPEAWSWERLAEAMREREASCLAVVNTKKDALAAYKALIGPDDDCVRYLSTLLCGAHRKKIIEEVTEALEQERRMKGLPVLLVSTQLIEAGVDLDFPFAYRAQGPLDRIVQTAGRCNREGRRDRSESEVVIFVPKEGKAPSGDYATAMWQAWNMIADPNKPFDFDSPAAITDYFRRFYVLLDSVGLDKCKVQEDRKKLRFPEVATKVRLIDEDTIPVLVPYGNQEMFDNFVDEIRNRAQRKQGMTRELWRRVQPYTVAMYRQDSSRDDSLLDKVIEDQIWIWLGKYDDKTGCAEFAAEMVA